MSGVTVQLCGDAHLSNFGLFGTPERRMIFDINDFDETLPGPVGVGRQAPGGKLRGHGTRPGLLPRRSARIVMAGVAEYRDRMRQAAGMGTLEAWYDQLEAGELLKLCAKRCASNG